MKEYINSILIVIIIYFFIFLIHSKPTEYFENYNYNTENYNNKLVHNLKKDAYMDFLADFVKKLNVNSKNVNSKIKLECQQKANTACELTNPMLYLTNTPHFPPRWIFKPYRDVSLPKHTDLKCWDNISNCCKQQ